jgi:DNA-binding transcriptional MerR regulator
MAKLDQFKQMPPCTAEALVSYLGELLPRITGAQERYKVTDIPSIRTLRFYTSRGMLDKPLAYDGRTALYGYRHLLQVVVIKCLQANHLPLTKVREMLQGLRNEDLEGLLEISGENCQAGKFELPDYQEPPPGKDFSQPAKGPGLASPLLQGILKSKFDTLPPKPKKSMVAWEADAIIIDEGRSKPASWQRLEVEPGVELHLREDIKVKAGSQLDVLLARIKHLLQQQGKD